MGILSTVVAFVLGGVASLLAALVVAWSLLVRASQRQMAAAAAAQPPAPAPPTQSEDEVRAWVHLHKYKPKDTATAMSGPLHVAAFTDGILYIYPNDKATACSHLLPLDGFGVEMARTHRTRWHRSNALKITPPSERPDLALPGGWSELFLTFDTAKDLERWFYLLMGAAGGRSDPGTRDAARGREHFSTMPPSQGGGPFGWDSAFNILVHRIWWALHSDSVVLGALRSKIDKKLSRLKLPPLVTRLRVSELEIGPNLPLVRRASLVSLSPQGEFHIDADVDYTGGFVIAIECTVVVAIPMTSKQLTVPLGVRCVAKRGRGRVRLSMHPPPSRCLWFAFHEVPDADIDVTTHIGNTGGAHAQLSLTMLPPRVVDTIVSKLRQEIVELFVLPNMEDLPIASPMKSAAKRAKTAATAAASASAPPQPVAMATASLPATAPGKEASAASNSAPAKQSGTSAAPPSPALVPAAAALAKAPPAMQLHGRSVSCATGSFTVASPQLGPMAASQQPTASGPTPPPIFMIATPPSQRESPVQPSVPPAITPLATSTPGSPDPADLPAGPPSAPVSPAGSPPLLAAGGPQQQQPASPPPLQQQQSALIGNMSHSAPVLPPLVPPVTQSLPTTPRSSEPSSPIVPTRSHGVLSLAVGAASKAVVNVFAPPPGSQSERRGFNLATAVSAVTAASAAVQEVWQQQKQKEEAALLLQKQKDEAALLLQKQRDEAALQLQQRQRDECPVSESLMDVESPSPPQVPNRANRASGNFTTRRPAPPPPQRSPDIVVAEHFVNL